MVSKWRNKVLFVFVIVTSISLVRSSLIREIVVKSLERERTSLEVAIDYKSNSRVFAPRNQVYFYNCG